MTTTDYINGFECDIDALADDIELAEQEARLRHDHDDAAGAMLWEAEADRLHRHREELRRRVNGLTM